MFHGTPGPPGSITRLQTVDALLRFAKDTQRVSMSTVGFIIKRKLRGLPQFKDADDDTFESTMNAALNVLLTPIALAMPFVFSVGTVGDTKAEGHLNGQLRALGAEFDDGVKLLNAQRAAQERVLAWFDDTYGPWLGHRERSIRVLRDSAHTMENVNRDVGISTTVGGTATVVVCGWLWVFPLAGALATAVVAGVGVAGALTAAGASIADAAITKGVVESVTAGTKPDIDAINVLLGRLDAAAAATKAVEVDVAAMALHTGLELAKHMVNHVALATGIALALQVNPATGRALQGGARLAGRVAARVAGRLGRVGELVTAFAATARTAGRAASVVPVLNVLLAFWDVERGIARLVNGSDIAQQFRDNAEELEAGRAMVEKLHDDIAATAPAEDATSQAYQAAWHGLFTLASAEGGPTNGMHVRAFPQECGSRRAPYAVDAHRQRVDTWEAFTVEVVEGTGGLGGADEVKEGGQRVTLRSFHSRLLRADNMDERAVGGGVFNDATGPAEGAQFRLEPLGGSEFALKTAWGTYVAVAAPSDGDAGAPVVHQAERFRWTIKPAALARSHVAAEAAATCTAVADDEAKT